MWDVSLNFELQFSVSLNRMCCNFIDLNQNESGLTVGVWLYKYTVDIDRINLSVVCGGSSLRVCVCVSAAAGGVSVSCYLRLIWTSCFLRPLGLQTKASLHWERSYPSYYKPLFVLISFLWLNIMIISITFLSFCINLYFVFSSLVPGSYWFCVIIFYICRRQRSWVGILPLDSFNVSS